MNMRVLIVRLSSMGDLVQTLPALTDAAKAIPNVCFDWIADESFAEVAAWHPQVETVMPSALRRWRRDWLAAWRRREPQEFMRQVRSRKYDLVVDVQCELKSAMMTRLARGPRVGYEKRSVHEWGAQFAYQRKVFVPKGQHSMMRMRRLLSVAMGYEYDESVVDYGLDAAKFPLPRVALSNPYVVFIHSTSWTSKNWPEHYWQELAKKTLATGLGIVLPWGDENERERAERIGGNHPQALVLPPLSISEKAAIIARAQATVGLDTGLSHIAAAFDVPSVSIYGATDPALVGAIGRNQIHYASKFECVGCHDVKCTYTGPAAFKPACLVEITPERVWKEFERAVAHTLV